MCRSTYSFISMLLIFHLQCFLPVMQLLMKRHYVIFECLLYKLVLYLCHQCHQCNRSCVGNSVVTQSTLVIFNFPTNDLLSYKILSEICLLCWRHFCASWMKWKYLMVLFNCKTINICYASSSVGTGMCHCVIHSLWLGLVLQTVPGAGSVPCAHTGSVSSNRRGAPRIGCIHLKIAFTSEWVRSKVRERTSTKTERTTDKKCAFYILLRIVGDDNLILCDSKYLLLFSLWDLIVVMNEKIYFKGFWLIGLGVEGGAICLGNEM